MSCTLICFTPRPFFTIQLHKCIIGSLFHIHTRTYMSSMNLISYILIFSTNINIHANFSTWSKATWTPLLFALMYFLKNSLWNRVFFLKILGLLSIIICSFNENRGKIICRNVYKQVPSRLAYMWWKQLPWKPYINKNMWIGPIE